MILLVSDVQGHFDVINAQIAHAERHAARPVEAVILPGDLGLCEPHMTRFFRKRGERFHRPFYYVEGNHEDFECFDRNVKRYVDVMTHMPRGTTHLIAGHRILALGGSAYMDAHNTPLAALITPRDIERCLRHPRTAADVLVTHDCPKGIGVSGAAMFRHLPPPGFEGSRQLLDHFRPRLWVFGHHHRWYETRIDGTHFLGLPEAWRGYALLHPDQQVERIDHHVPLPPGKWELLKAMLLRRPRPHR